MSDKPTNRAAPQFPGQSDRNSQSPKHRDLLRLSYSGLWSVPTTTEKKEREQKTLLIGGSGNRVAPAFKPAF